MQKNIIIAGLIVWNVMLMAALIFLWVNSRRTTATAASNPASAPMQKAERESTEEIAEHIYTFKQGDRVVNENAPLILNRDLTLSVTFETQNNDGVLFAQGGVAHGYALYLQDGQLIFAVRRKNALTTVDGGAVTAGRHSAKATLSKTGEFSVALDGKAPVTGQAEGGFTMEPVDGFDVGGDRGAAVGPYKVPNEFGGTIESVRLKTTP